MNELSIITDHTNCMVENNITFLLAIGFAFIVALQTIIMVNLLKTTETSILNKISRFARTTEHEHNFVENICEFCKMKVRGRKY